MVRVGKTQFFRYFADRVTGGGQHNHGNPNPGLENILMGCDSVGFSENTKEMFFGKGKMESNVG